MFPSLITVSATVVVEVGVAATVFAAVAVTAFVGATVLAVAGDAPTVMLRPAQKDLPHSRATIFASVRLRAYVWTRGGVEFEKTNKIERRPYPDSQSGCMKYCLRS